MGAHPYGAQLRPQRQSKNLPRVIALRLLWYPKKSSRIRLFDFFDRRANAPFAVPAPRQRSRAFPNELRSSVSYPEMQQM